MNHHAVLTAAADAGGWRTPAGTLTPSETTVRVADNPAPMMPFRLTPWVEVFVTYSGARYTDSVNGHAKRPRFPVNGPLVAPTTSVDDPAHAEIPGAVALTLSPSRPFADRPDRDTVVWLDILNGQPPVPTASGSRPTEDRKPPCARSNA